MDVQRTRPPRDTGPIELRDFGPTGRRLGTPADCYDGSPWELHRGELVEQLGGKDIHGIPMALLAALFRTHARPGLTVTTSTVTSATPRAHRRGDLTVGRPNCGWGRPNCGWRWLAEQVAAATPSGRPSD